MRLCTVVVMAALLTPMFSSAMDHTQQDATRKDSIALSRYAQLPLLFEANRGQASVDADFISRGPGYNLYLNARKITLALRHGRGFNGNENTAGDVIAIEIFDGDSNCRLHGVEELKTQTNYLIGNQSGRWQTGVQTYGKVEYENVYPGIDLIFYGSGGNIEYDFVVHAGADYRKIKLSIEGQSAESIENDGTLVLPAGLGTLRFRTPIIYQESAQGKTNVKGRFVLSASQGHAAARTLSFEVSPYDHTRPLTIDPVLDYSTYLGGSDNDGASKIAVDSSGSAYIVGTTASLNFPTTPGAVDPTHTTCIPFCYDVFVAKINPAGTGLVYATYVGGNGEDFGSAIAVDSAGNAYIAGATTSTDFPTSGTALQKSCGGTCFRHDAFAFKLNSTGSALLYSTYIGGSDEDWGTGIAVRQGNAYVSGFSASPDFPTTAGAFQKSMQGQGSSFVLQLNTNGTALNFSTFLGEVDLDDAGGEIALDSSGNSYVAGNTLSPNFPRTIGAFHTSFLNMFFNNLYVLKLNSTGSSLIYSALIGGASPGGITVDAVGNAYVAASAGPFYPVTPGAVDQSCQGNFGGALLLKVNPSGSNLLTSAHICPDRLWPAGVALDASQNIIFSGYTDAANLPTTVGSFQPSMRNTCCFSDAILGKMKADGSALVYMTYFGGNRGDSGIITKDSSGNIYMTGYTSSTNLQLKTPFQTANAGSMDAFIAKFTIPLNKISLSPATLTFSKQGLNYSSKPLQVAVANLSTSTIPISAFVASGDFSASSNCGAQILAGAHCAISVVFKPTLTGSRSGTLTLTDGIGVQNVRLSGIGIAGPSVTFSSANEIETAPNTASAPFPITITNIGNTTLKITQIGLTNGPSFGFYSVGNCFQGIAPQSSCIVNLTFNGSSFGRDFSIFSVADNAPGSPQSFLVSGNVNVAGLVFGVPGGRFGQQKVGTSSAAQKISLLNGTGAGLSISSIQASANFKQNNTCGVTLAAGAFCYINVSFNPTSIGIKQGRITVVDTASGSPHGLPLLGTGY